MNALTIEALSVELAIVVLTSTADIFAFLYQCGLDCDAHCDATSARGRPPEFGRKPHQRWLQRVRRINARGGDMSLFLGVVMLLGSRTSDCVVLFIFSSALLRKLSVCPSVHHQDSFTTCTGAAARAAPCGRRNQPSAKRSAQRG